MDADLQSLVYGFVGLGLMGGSLARAVRERILSDDSLGQKTAAGRILACDIRPQTLELAAEDNTIDEGFPLEKADEMLARCDIVYICLYPKAALAFISAHRASFKQNAVVTDIAGVKTELCSALKNGLLPEDGADFIPGHPMAGSEKEGFIHSSANIFDGRNYILMPQPRNRPENLSLLKRLITALGFSRIIETTADIHDHKIAFTSQLCHVIASALVQSAEDTNITAFGGGSFEDLTRIAMINAPLWTELFLENRAELLAHISAFEDALGRIKKCIGSCNAAELQDILEQVRARRIIMQKPKNT
ncbi:MAG: prephenate dehydrogenase [Bacteroides sp.]|nr:prephenate dehydrogenase [Prevotella sp.]MCM1406874.1 prephenate dehydrogenase [Treponema brennaborense]MCM1470025.1 prephenate dehydrogenase [Bacteroides sp.]